MVAHRIARAAGRAGFAAGWSSAVVGMLAVRQRLAGGPSFADERSARLWARGLLYGLRVRVQALQVPFDTPRRRPRLVVANHRSPLDIPIILSLLGGRFLSRGDIAGWPVIGTGARMLGTVFVDRADTESRTSAIRKVRRLLTEEHSVCVFPEGTTFEGDEVRPFQAGIFASLRGLACEILPVGLAYDPGTEFVEPSMLEHARKLLARPHTNVTIAVGPRIPDGPGARALAHTARDHVQQLVDRARAHHHRGA